jgi:hypothetical protein
MRAYIDLLRAALAPYAGILLLILSIALVASGVYHWEDPIGRALALAGALLYFDLEKPWG